MARVVYKLVDGLAVNVRSVKDTYVLKPGELEQRVNKLPEPDTLSTSEAVESREAQIFTALSVEDVLNLLKAKGLINDEDIASMKEAKQDAFSAKG